MTLLRLENVIQRHRERRSGRVFEALRVHQLTVEAGAELRFLEDRRLLVEGAIEVQGTQEDPVLFTSEPEDRAPAPGDWDSVEIQSDGVGNLIEHVRVEYAVCGLRFLLGGEATVRYSEFTLNEKGVCSGGGAFSHGVVDNSHPVVNRSSIHDNTLYDYYAWHYADTPNEKLDATENWWGTTTPATIAGMVYDNADDPALGTVDTANYLSAPNTSAPITPPQNLLVTDNGPGSVDLSWDANSETDVTGYKVYYGYDYYYPHDGSDAVEGASGIDVGNVTSYTLTGLDSGTHYFLVTAYDAGSESWYSTYYYFWVSN